MSRKHKERREKGHFGGGRLDDFGDTIIVHAISRGTRYKPQFSPSELLFLFHRNALFSSTTKEVGGKDNDDDDDTIIETRTKKMMETFHPLMRHIFASSKCASCVHAIDFSSNINNNNKIEDDVDGRKKTSKQLHNVLKRINAKDRAISIAFGSKESLIVLNALMQHDKMESVMSVVLMNPIPTNDDASSSSSSSREFAKACEEIREGAIGTVKIFVVLSQGVVWVNSRLTTPLQWLHKHSEPVRVYAVNQKPWFKDDADEDDDEQKRKQLLFRRSFSLCGDRRNHLVFEGVKDAEKLRETLDACLCEYDTAFDGDDFCEKKEEANFFIACQQVWESVPDTMERCGVIAEGRGGAGCVALMQQKERVFLKDKTSSSLLSQDKLSAKEDVEEKEEQKEGKKLLPLGGKIGVRVTEAFLRPTKQQGETNVFSNNRNLTGHYFPKMPCLACGSPWWIGDGGWNSTCANCGEDDRCYGLDQMPLRQFRGKHRTFCEMVLSMDVCRDD